MRLEPVETPRGWLMRLAYWMTRRQLGKVPSALKVIYARAPKLLTLGYRMRRVVDAGLSIEPELALLIETQASLLNGCGFCGDLVKAMAVRRKLGLEKFDALLDHATSPHFSDRERAALAWCAEITRTRSASDAAFQSLRKHFDEREIVELTWLNALSNYYNLMAVPLGLDSDELTRLALSSTR
jgi:alkylhydroperoxidase family enzyme